MQFVCVLSLCRLFLLIYAYVGQLDQGEVEYLEMENEVEMSTSDEDYKPPQSVESSGKKRPRGRPPKKASSKASGSNEGRSKRTSKPEVTEKKTKVVSYICDFCGNKYPTQGRLTEHIKLHKGIKPHECE